MVSDEVSDEAVGAADTLGGDVIERATGFRREHWFDLLDNEGAASWLHPEIAAWLASHEAITSWWAQHVAVAYEQARGIRRPGQRQDGSFEVSVSRTVALDETIALNDLADVVTDALGIEPLSRNLAAKYPTARFKLGEREFVLASVSPKATGVTIGLTWGGLPDGERLGELKKRMREWLGRVG